MVNFDWTGARWRPAVASALAALFTTVGAARAEGSPATDRVVLSDGQVLVGQATIVEGVEVLLVLGDGRALTLPWEVVAGIEVSGAEVAGGARLGWDRDANRSRYLYSPSAFPLGKRHGYVAQRELALTSVGYGVLDFWDVEAGTVLPTLFVEDGFVAFLGTKLVAPVGDRVHLGVGGQAARLPESSSIGFLFANVTLGDEDRHFTAATGPAMNFSDWELGAWVGTLSFSQRLGPKISFISENWLLYLPEGDGPWNGPFFVVPSGGVRLFGPHFATDLALVPIIVADSSVPVIPAPWATFTWNW